YSGVTSFRGDVAFGAEEGRPDSAAAVHSSPAFRRFSRGGMHRQRWFRPIRVSFPRKTARFVLAAPGPVRALLMEGTPLSRRLIASGSPFEKTVGFSRAVADGRWCFVSGTVGFDADGNMPDDVTEQARNALATIRQALESAGFSFRDVIRARYVVSERR